MKKRIFSIVSLVALLALLVSALPAAAVQGPQTDGPAKALPKTSGRLIVELEDVPLAGHWRSAEVTTLSGPTARPDVQAPDAQEYLNFLASQQDAFKMELAKAMPEARVGGFRDSEGNLRELSYRVVFNGLALQVPDDSDATVRRLQRLPGVKRVYRDYAHMPDMYASIPLIDAPAMWEQLGGQGMSGEGIIVASIDTGVYAPNPFFDPAGYAYPPGYPVGDARYTTEKVIGARAYFRAWDPPLAGDDGAWPGPAGSSHGTHTMGTTAGNANTVANVAGVEYTISGVAPQAQILSYRIGYPTASEYSGSAFTAEIVKAYEDAVWDGADVINYSFGGYSGVMPWADGVAVARDWAWWAGVFVSHSAGNSGPGSSTTWDSSPTVMEVAASSTTGTIASGRFNVTAPEPVPDELLDIPYATAAFGPALPSGQIVGPFDYVTSDSIDAANFEGCNAWPAAAFDGKAAVISRGVCEFGLKVLNAEQAGAVFVVIRNHAAGGEGLVSMGGGAVGDQVTIPSIFIGHTNGLALVDWYAANGAVSQFAVDTFAFQLGNVPDVIASFSSRGPAFARFLEPDVTAPGVNILSGGYASGATGVDQHAGFGQASGTSMAAPHVAGAAALLKQLHPDWWNDQIKSALMSTSVTEVWLDAGHTVPASVLDMGAGRIDLGKAGDPGLTFYPPSLSFGPLNAGDVKTLSVWALDVSGAGGLHEISVVADAGIAASVTPASHTFAPGEALTFDVTVDTTGAAPGDYTGMIWLDDGVHLNHIPLWVRVEAPMGDARVLLVDNDFSYLVGYPDYAEFYAGALDSLGVAYDYYNADAHYANPRTLPTAAELAAYDVIIYWSGDNYYPNGSFTVATPLTVIDMQTLTDWQFGGGCLIASGQDLASAWDALDSGGDGYFLYAGNLGTKYLQDSIFDPGYAGILPPVPAVVGQPGSIFSGLTLDISGSAPIIEDDELVGWEDGAANQYYVDEVRIAPYGDTEAPDSIYPIFAAIDGAQVESGFVGAARYDAPTLEQPWTRYPYRSLYLSFGFEGINSDTGFTTRDEVMARMVDFCMDDLSVEVSGPFVVENPFDVATFEASVTSSVGAAAVEYRWDFGDYWGPFETSTEPVAVHVYEREGVYNVRVEVTDELGHKAISEPWLVEVQRLPLPEPVTVVLPAAQDAYVSSWAPDANYGAGLAFKVRQTGVMNGLVQFDLWGISQGATVLEAKLKLYPTFRSNGNQLYLSVYPLEQWWWEGDVTWNTAPAASDTAEATMALNAVNTRVVLDVTALVQQWVNDPMTNYGMQLKGDGAKKVEYLFIAKEFGWEGGPTYPVLEVTYQ